MAALTGVIDQLIRELLGSTQELVPYEADQRALWALKRAWVAAFGPGGATEALAAMPDMTDADERVEFLDGLVDGVGESVATFVKEQVDGVVAAVRGLLAFYGVVYDAQMWVQMLAVWVDKPGTSVETFERFLKTDYPEMYAAVTGFAPFVAELNAFAGRLRDRKTPAGERWRVCEQLVAEWLIAAPQWLGRQLRPHVGAFVAAKGDAHDQGVVVGRVGGRVIIEVVLMAVAVDDLARTARGVQGLAGQARMSLTSAERASAVANVQRSAPALATAASGVSQAERAAMRIYEELATEIASHTKLKKKTGAFNREVRDIYGLTASSVEYVSLRLDAHHIVKGSMFKDFPAEFTRAFGWKKAGDMDCVALHTEWHIRSGEKLRTNLKLHGAEREKSLSYALDTYIAKWQRDNGKFSKLEDVFVAHEEFYRGYSSRLHQQLEPWFTAALAKIRNGG